MPPTGLLCSSVSLFSPQKLSVFLGLSTMWAGAACVFGGGSDRFWIFSNLRWVLVPLISALLLSSQSPSHKSKRQQQELIAELRRRQVKDNRHVYEGKDGAIEDIITGKGHFLVVARGDSVGLAVPAACRFRCCLSRVSSSSVTLVRPRIVQTLLAFEVSYSSPCTACQRSPQALWKISFLSIIGG